MDMKYYTQSHADFMANGNIVKEELLRVLEKDGLLKDTAENIGTKYLVIFAEPSWFGKMISKLFNKEDKLVIQIVKMT